MPSPGIVPLETLHLPHAAALVCKRYANLRERVPCMPPRYEDPQVVLPMLRDLSGGAPGVAAVREGQLVGFMVAYLLPNFRGRQAAYSPAWANGAEGTDARRTSEAMYTALAARWVDGGYLTHLVGALAHERELLQTWHWLGFGMLAADGVRELSPLRGTPGRVAIRRAGQEDAAVCDTLEVALRDHLASSPTFLFVDPEEGPSCAGWLAEPRHALWLAYEDQEPVAYLRMQPEYEDAFALVQDPGTISVTGAYTVPRARGKGIGTALLGRALLWARQQGYARLAVDFEPMNVLAARFWLQHFQPVCYAAYRQVDPPTGRRSVSEPTDA
jgi:GNAT superfamily N-acetyltransferase